MERVALGEKGTGRRQVGRGWKILEQVGREGREGRREKGTGRRQVGRVGEKKEQQKDRWGRTGDTGTGR